MAHLEYKPVQSQLTNVADYVDSASQIANRGVNNLNSAFGTLNDIVRTTQANRALDSILNAYDPNNPMAVSQAVNTALANRPDISPEMRMHMATNLRNDLFQAADRENLYNAKRQVDALQNDVNAQFANANIPGLNKANLALRNSGVRSDALQFGDKDKLLNSAAERDLKGSTANLQKARLKEQEDLRFANDVTAAMTMMMFDATRGRSYASEEDLNQALFQVGQRMSANIPGLDGLDSATRLRAIEAAIAKTKDYLNSGFVSADPFNGITGSYNVKRRNLVKGTDTTYNVPFNLDFIKKELDAQAQSANAGSAKPSADVVTNAAESAIGKGNLTPIASTTGTPVATAQTPTTIGGGVAASGPAANPTSTPAAPVVPTRPTVPTSMVPAANATGLQQSIPAAGLDAALNQVIGPKIASPANVPSQEPAQENRTSSVTPEEQKAISQAVKEVDDTVNRTMQNITSASDKFDKSPLNQDNASNNTKLADTEDAFNKAVKAYETLKYSKDPVELAEAEKYIADNVTPYQDLPKTGVITNDIQAPDSTVTPANQIAGSEGTTASFKANKDAANTAWTGTNTTEPKSIWDNPKGLLKEAGRILAGSVLPFGEGLFQAAESSYNNYNAARGGRIDALQEQKEVAASEVEKLRAGASKKISDLSKINFFEDMSEEKSLEADALVNGVIADLTGMTSYLNSSVDAEYRALSTDHNFASITVGDNMKDLVQAMYGMTVDKGEPGKGRDLGLIIGKDLALTTENIASANNKDIVQGFIDSIDGDWSYTGNEKNEIYGAFNRTQAKLYNALSTGAISLTNPVTGNKVTSFSNADALKYSKMLALSIIQTATEDYTGASLWRGGRGDIDFNSKTVKNLTEHCVESIRNPNSKTTKAIIQLGKVNLAREGLTNSYGSFATARGNAAKQKNFIDDPANRAAVVDGLVYHKMAKRLPTLGKNLNNYLEEANYILRP